MAFMLAVADPNATRILPSDSDSNLKFSLPLICTSAGTTKPLADVLLAVNRVCLYSGWAET